MASVPIDARRLKASFDLRSLFEAEGIQPDFRTSNYTMVCCPFHNEKKASCSVHHDHAFCFGCGQRTDHFDLLKVTRGFSFIESCKHLEELSGGRLVEPGTYKPSKPIEPTLQPIILKNLIPDARHGSSGELHRLCKARKLPFSAVAGLEQAQKDGVLLFGTWKEQLCWVVTDHQRYVAEARRLDGKPFRIAGEGKTLEIKSWTLPGTEGRKKWPVNIVQASKASKVIMVEGGPDLLAAFALRQSMGENQKIGVCGMLGSHGSLHSLSHSYFRGKSVRLLQHNDQGGKKMEEKLRPQLEPLGASFEVWQGKKGEDFNDYLTRRLAENVGGISKHTRHKFNEQSLELVTSRSS